jgi:hypothetical protein
MQNPEDDKSKKVPSPDQSANDGHEHENDHDHDNHIEGKRNRGDWLPQDGSEVHKLFISTKRKEKPVEGDSTYEGIFLYKPGVELPSLFHFANELVPTI